MTAPALLLDCVPTVALRGGRVSGVRGLVVEAVGLELPIGAMVEVESSGEMAAAEVVGLRAGQTQLMLLAPTRGVAAGDRVWPITSEAAVNVGDFLLGRAVDGLGKPIDGGALLPIGKNAPLYPVPLTPMDRPVLDRPLDSGVRAINACTTLARGQRIGLFAGSGVGKSTLMGMLVRGTDADVRVVALIGERGREVREFIERELGDARSSTVIVAVPSDAPALLRVRGAHLATAIAEAFRDRGRDVLLMMDSVTRFALALREIGLARGEPAATRGYTPSVFAELPLLLERAGRSNRGSITGIYTVLVEGGDLEDPIADSLRAILDGHIVLSRDLAERGHFPPIDVLASVSRAMPIVTSEAHGALAGRLRELLASYRDAEDLIQVGAYANGSDAVVDEAIARRPELLRFLRQLTHESQSIDESLEMLGRALGRDA